VVGRHTRKAVRAPASDACLALCPAQLPYLVGNIVEILELKDEDDVEDDGANVDLDSHRKGKCTVIKTSTRQTIFLPVVGLVDPEKLEPGDLVGVNKDSYLILDTLPAEYDSRVKAMEVDEKPSEEYSDIGGLDKQIQELVEALVLPLTHKERFESIGIRAPKGVLLYGPPGTGKTLMARACAAQTNACFLKLAGPQLVQMFFGDGAKLVRDAFLLAKEKSGPVRAHNGCLRPRLRTDAAPFLSMHCARRAVCATACERARERGRERGAQRAHAPVHLLSRGRTTTGRSFSSMSWTRWARSVLTLSFRETGRCKGPCWSCSTSSMVSAARTASRCSAPRCPCHCMRLSLCV